MRRMRGYVYACWMMASLLISGCEDDERVVSEPEVASVEPLQGVAGIEVVINGKHFRKDAMDTKVSFNGIQATVVHVDDEQIIVQVPDFAGTGEVIVESVLSTDAGSVNHTASAGIFTVPGGIDHSFNAGGRGPDNRIEKMMLLPNGKIMVAGFFKTYNDVPSALVARLNADGSLDESFDMQAPSYGTFVRDFDVAPDGSIIITGSFEYNSYDQFHVARVLPDGSHDATGLIGIGPTNGTIFCLAVQNDGKIMAGGDFDKYSFISAGSPLVIVKEARNHIVRLNQDFSLDESFDPGQGFDGPVHSIEILDNGDMMVAGEFHTYNDAPANGMVLLHPDGSSATGFSVGEGFGGGIPVTLLELPGGKWMVSGTFTNFQGANVRGLIRLNADGSHDKSFTWQSASTLPGIYSMALDSDGNLAIGEAFGLDHMDRSNVVMVDDEGHLLPFNAGSTFHGMPYAPPLVFDSENRLLVGAQKEYRYHDARRGAPFRVLTSD